MLLRILTEPQQGATHDQLLAVARRTDRAELIAARVLPEVTR